MKSFPFAFYLFGLLFLQLAILPFFHFGRAVPQLILAAVVWLSFQSSEKRVFAAVFAGGLFVDLYSGIFFGAYTFALLFSALTAKFLTTRVFPKEGSVALFGSALILCQMVFQAGLYGAQWLLSELAGFAGLGYERFFSWFFPLQMLTTLVFGLAHAYLSGRLFEFRGHETRPF